MLRIFEYTSIGSSSIWTGWMPLSEYWTSSECYWVHVNAFEWLWTIAEHPLSVHECQWVSVNSLWTPLTEHECHWVSVNTHWVCMNVIELFLNATYCGVTTRKNAFVWELNSPWTWLSTHEHLWVSGNTPLNSIECAWMPLSEYWTLPEHYWVHVNAFEWVWTAPEHAFSAFESVC